jgi:hypothetical protein
LREFRGTAQIVTGKQCRQIAGLQERLAPLQV